MRGKRGAVPLALAVVATGLAAAPASAVVSTIYVQNGFGSSCSDTGTGSSAAPFCTISKAASVVQPGQTVMVGYGDYPETVTITAKGTAAAPIRFVGQSTLDNNLATWVGSDGATNSGNHAFVLNGAQYVALSGFAVSGNQGALVLQNAKNVTLDKLQFVNERGENPDIQVSGSSSSVTISNDWLDYGIELDAGTSGTTIVNDTIPNGWYTGSGTSPTILATGATGTTIESDTISTPCTQGIDLEGASTGALIVNNVVTTASTDGTPCGSTGATPITVAAAAVSGTAADYNLVHDDSGPLYSWNGTDYPTVSAFSSATGQGTHDLAADPKLVAPPDSYLFSTSSFYPSEGSPEVDSGDAAHVPATDILGLARVDDPLVTNAGSGTGYADRGAFEYQDPIAMIPMTVKHVAGGSPLDISISSGVKAAWSNQITYTYDFRDGAPQTVTSGLTTSMTHDYAQAGYEGVSVTANDGYASVAQNDQNQYSNFILGADYTPMSPSRMLDTRKGIGAPAVAVAPNADVTLTVGGVNGIPMKGLSAVAMNVTVTQPTANGYLTVYPHGDFLPQASSLNFTAGQSVPNLVTTLVRDGKVNFHNGSGGTVQVIADVEGYYADSGYGFKPVAPVRVLDTRKPVGVPTKAPVPANGHIALDLSSSVPAGTKAVTMNVTVTNPRAGGYLTVYPDGSTAPVASNLNFSAGQTVPNLVTVPVNNGKVDFQNSSSGTVDVVADLAGYYGDGTTGATAGLAANDPDRIWDTRVYGQTPGPVAANGTLHLNAGDFLFSPPAPVALVLNVTATGPTAAGYLTVYPDGSSRPTASNLNFSAGQTVPNLVSVGLGADGVDLFNGSSGKTNIIVDMDGMFVQPL
jgi:hypothetical protein